MVKTGNFAYGGAEAPLSVFLFHRIYFYEAGRLIFAILPLFP